MPTQPLPYTVRVAYRPTGFVTIAKFMNEGDAATFAHATLEDPRRNYDGPDPLLKVRVMRGSKVLTELEAPTKEECKRVAVLRALGRQRYPNKDDREIDTDARVSLAEPDGEGLGWIQAWLWVPRPVAIPCPIHPEPVAGSCAACDSFLGAGV